MGVTNIVDSWERSALPGHHVKVRAFERQRHLLRCVHSKQDQRPCQGSSDSELTTVTDALCSEAGSVGTSGSKALTAGTSSARLAIAPTAGDAPAGDEPPGEAAAMLPAALGCAAPACLPACTITA